MPKISVIVSIYNAGRTQLQGRLENLLTQKNLDDIEIICVNSGSPHPDDAIVLDEYRRHYPEHVKVITTTRDPLYVSWNLAIQQAAGEYIINANCDDRFAPHALRVLAEALDNGADVAYSSWWCTVTDNPQWNGDWEPYYGDPVWYPEGRVDWGNQPFSYTRLAEYCYLGPGPMFRKNLWELVGGFDESFLIAGDYDMWAKFALAGAVFQSVPLYLGLFYHNDGQLSRSNGEQLTHENWRIRMRYFSKLKAMG